MLGAGTMGMVPQRGDGTTEGGGGPGLPMAESPESALSQVARHVQEQDGILLAVEVYKQGQGGKRLSPMYP